MRADRLLTLIMLLQKRGRMTAREIAKILEVSERTVYRDINALSSVGVPVYSEIGRAGGYSLLEDFRPTLTGFTEREVRALFMINIPAQLADLGLRQELNSALLKLSNALPNGYRNGEGWVRQRLHLDSTWWHQNEGAVPHLQTIHQAVWQDRKLLLSYQPLPSVHVEQTVEAYGLVAKAGIWYLVYNRNGQFDVQRASHLYKVRLLDENFLRRNDFDLAGFWDTWCKQQEDSSTRYPITLRVAPDLIPMLPMFFGDRIQEKITQAGPADKMGWITLALSFESLEAARGRVLELGGAVEVLAPYALRLSVQDFATQILSLYTKNVPKFTAQAGLSSETIEKHAFGQHEPDVCQQGQEDDEVGSIQELA
jgi:predicted DNA-binding transcriptional regulator YafY